MSSTDRTDRADATVWLPLLHILGGIAERVASRPAATPAAPPDKAGAGTPADGREAA